MIKDKKPLTDSRNLLLIAATLSLLFVVTGFTAMQFVEGADWDIADFVLAGALPLFVYLVYIVITKMTKNPLYRLVGGIALIFSVLLVVADQAVGIFE